MNLMKKQFDEFKKFISHGNVVDLAVGVVIGAAFTAVVNSMVKDLITPFIASLGGKPDFSGLAFEINGSKFMYGNFFNALLSFLIVAAVIFFLVVKPVNKLTELSSRNQEPTTAQCAECLSEIMHQAKRCRYCGSPQSIKPTKLNNK